MTFSEAKKEAARKACLRHPDKLMVVDMLEGGYEIGCVSCKREGTTPQIARRPGRVAERLGEMVRDREIAVREGQYQELVPTAPVREQEPLTIEVFQERIKLVKAVVAEMEESVHYGIIPGTSDKSLWEPGAEYLRMAFGITWNYEMLMEHEDYETSDFHYKVRAFALSPDGAEVAFFPPVSGGSALPTIIQVTREPFDLNSILARITLPTTGAGCLFTGMVRGVTTRGDAHETMMLEYEAYEPMAEEKMGQIADEMRTRFPDIVGVAIIQRIGQLAAETPTVVVACTASHRDTGVFEAAHYGIDRLKEIAPIWKKEVGPDGASWVEGDYYPKPGE